MSNRFDLIARKHAVRGQIERLRRQVAQEQARGDRANTRKVRRLENQIEQLMAEEYRLRLEIDRSQ